MTPGSRHFVAILAAFTLLGTVPLAAQARALDWTAFSVDARLDSAGRLFVRERQTMLFNGDLNGGERIFDLRPGQRFVFRRLLRADSVTGADIEMREGSLDDIDSYVMTDRRTLRWRARQPDDDEFVNTKITYVLEYEYADILVPDGTDYRLDHEFGFRDRTGTIANFDLTLRIDPAWRTPATFTGVFREAILEPGIGYVVNIPLRWRAAGIPSAVRRSPELPLRIGLMMATLLAMIAMTVRFLRDEIAIGRFAPLTPLSAIDRPWLEQHVQSLRPEVVGYAWDEQVGPAEVSATLARLVHEKKLASRVESPGPKFLRQHVLHLELLVPRGDLQGYEKALVDGFFAPNATSTSTESIRERYKRSGFDPSRILRAPLTELFARVTGMAEPITSRRRWPLTVVMFGAAVALLGLALWTRPGDEGRTFSAALGSGLATTVFARIVAAFWRRRVVRPWRHLLLCALPMAAIAAAFCWVLMTGFGTLGLLALAGMAVMLIGGYHSVLSGARTTSSAARLQLRKQLASAREYCRIELQKPNPALDDSWYPYLLAFGLGRHTDRWFRSFGGESTQRMSRHGTSATSHSTNGASGGGFSGFGGGGGFSGAGATVAFGAAVGAIATGVAAPSSSSSGGGGGSRSSSGGSSGGGGGGGW